MSQSVTESVSDKVTYWAVRWQLKKVSVICIFVVCRSNLCSITTSSCRTHPTKIPVYENTQSQAKHWRRGDKYIQHNIKALSSGLFYREWKDIAEHMLHCGKSVENKLCCCCVWEPASWCMWGCVGSRQIGPRTVVNFLGVDSWAPGPNCPHFGGGQLAPGQLGPRTVGPRTVGPRGPTVRGPICLAQFA